MRAKSRTRSRLAFALVGATLLVVFFTHIGPKAIAAQLVRIGPHAIFILAPYAIGTAISALPWVWFLPPETRPGKKGVIAGRFAASGANSLLPFFGLAGEPTRLLWLERSARASGLAAIVVDRVLYNTAGVILLIAGGLTALVATSLPPSIGIAAVGIATVIFIATIAIAGAVSRWGVGHRLHTLLRKYLGDGPAARQQFGAQMDERVRRLLGGARRPLWLGLIVHVGGRVALCAEVFVALWILGVTPSVEKALVLATVPIATGLVASCIPSQLGVQEAAQSLMCGALGMNPAIGFALVLLQRMRQLAFVPLTPLLLAMARPKTARRADVRRSPALRDRKNPNSVLVAPLDRR